MTGRSPGTRPRRSDRRRAGSSSVDDRIRALEATIAGLAHAVEGRLEKVEQETGALGCLLRVAYAAHPASRALLGEAIDRGEKTGRIPDEFTQAYRRFQREVGAVVAERTKQRRATRATKKAQAAAAGGD